jgi:UDP-glucose 4-epimerase
LALGYILSNDDVLEIINIGTGSGTSILEIIKNIESLTGKKINYQVKNRRSGDPAILYADPSRAEKIIGWKAKRGLKEIIESAIDWHMKNG